MDLRLFVFLWSFWVGYSGAVEAQADTRRPFTVEDSIRMVRIVEPNAANSVFMPTKVELSPDGRFFAVVTQKGNLKTLKNEYELILYKTQDVLDYVNVSIRTDRELPEARVLTRGATDFNEVAFQSLKWSGDSKSLSFIGYLEDDAKVPGQVYEIAIETGKRVRLTNHPRPITQFAYRPISDKLLFASTLSSNNPDAAKPSYLVGVRNVNETFMPEEDAPPPAIQYYVQDVQRRQANPSDARRVGDVYPGSYWPFIWLSPDSRYAVVLVTNKIGPAHWMAGYDYLQSSFLQMSLAEFDENTMRRREDMLTQFSLIDLKDETLRPVFDAPTGLYKGGDRVEAHWLPDSKSVVLLNTALPLVSDSPDDLAKRKQFFAAAEYTIPTDAIRVMDYFTLFKSLRNPDAPSFPDVPGGHFTDFSLLADGTARLEVVDDRRDALPTRYFRKVDGVWRAIASVDDAETISADLLTVSVHQDVNTPPELAAHDGLTGARKVFTDFNPELRDLSMAKTEVVTWYDGHVRDWRGGLMRPVGYEEGIKYPLVIQTHGFFPKEYLVDGPFGVSSAYAAQALAGKGFVVFQLEDPVGYSQDLEQFMAYRHGLESLIDLLSEQGLIDREKVGLIAWSATGAPVQNMMINSDYPIAAAVVADSYNYGLLGYVGQFGYKAPAMAYMEKMIGAEPWGERLPLWVARNPELHLDKVKTPLRYEQYEKGLSGWWSIYTLLKRQQKPVEYYVFNDAAHGLVKPSHRLTSQQGTVDWFSFWLKGEEDPNSAKADQYVRWRKFKEQQKASVLNALKARGRAAH